MEKIIIRCDIFCKVVDNYGDIGVCWRLAKQLANEHGLAVRLWVDDLNSFARLCPEADVSLEVQQHRGVEVCHWGADTINGALSSSPSPASGRGWPIGRERGVADLVIETFSCKLPESYLAAMAARDPNPVWLNLEHLSAEDWVETHHKLPSPHPSLPLTRYFFFPGFTGKTGGLLLERDLLARRDAFQSDAREQELFWRSLGLDRPEPGTLKVSLFAYENAALAELLDVWAGGMQPVLCLVPEGRILPQVVAFFGVSQARPGDTFERGSLRVKVLPFVEQERYDELLWACDLNFVRGEDSFVRAQWAGRPFVWQIYPQHDGVHREKLRAFMDKYSAGLPTEAAQALRRLWEAWNGEPGDMPAAWDGFAAQRPLLHHHAGQWAKERTGNDLALNLLDFLRETGRMRAFKIEGQQT